MPYGINPTASQEEDVALLTKKINDLVKEVGLACITWTMVNFFFVTIIFSYSLHCALDIV